MFKEIFYFAISFGSIKAPDKIIQHNGLRLGQKYNIQLCAQLRVCSQAGGIPVYPRFSQPDNSESWDDAGNGI